MPTIAHSTAAMISGMEPQLRTGRYVFAHSSSTTEVEDLIASSIAFFREEEGLSLILPLEVAAKAGLDLSQPMRCITLNVYSSLEGVGLTAAVAGALGASGIACNVVAAYHHDHVFVPEADAERAVLALRTLQSSAAT